jgi:hypothetical protein
MRWVDSFITLRSLSQLLEETLFAEIFRSCRFLQIACIAENMIELFPQTSDHV